MIKEALQQDQLLTKEGALKVAGISNATLMKAISEGIVKPQLIKGRKKAMYLESEVIKVERREEDHSSIKSSSLTGINSSFFRVTRSRASLA